MHPRPNWKNSAISLTSRTTRHDACVGATETIFQGAQPPIASVCHTKVSHVMTYFPFPNPRRPEHQDRLPHDKHQDVIASLKSRPLDQRLSNSTHEERPRIVRPPSVRAGQTTKLHDLSCPNTKPLRLPIIVGSMVRAASCHLQAVPEKHDACFKSLERPEPLKDNLWRLSQPASPPGPAVSFPLFLSSSVTMVAVKRKTTRGMHHLHINIPSPYRCEPQAGRANHRCTECHNKEVCGRI